MAAKNLCGKSRSYPTATIGKWLFRGRIREDGLGMAFFRYYTRRRNCRLTGRPSSSWPGLSPPSTPILAVRGKDVDGVAKPRHDDGSTGTSSNPPSGIM